MPRRTDAVNRVNGDAGPQDPEQILDELLTVVRRDVKTLRDKAELSDADRRALGDYTTALVKAAAHRRKADDEDQDLNACSAEELDRMAEQLRRKAEEKRRVTA